MSDEQPVVLKNLRRTLLWCIRCIIHYDRNVKEKEVGQLTEASFCTIDDLQMFVKCRRKLHCVLMISARHFLRILTLWTPN